MDKLIISIEQSRSPATDEYESYLVIKYKGKTQPYLYIPDSFDDEVLDILVGRQAEQAVIKAADDWFGNQEIMLLTKIKDITSMSVEEKRLYRAVHKLKEAK